MEIGLKPKKTNITIMKMGGENYEVNFNEETWLYLDKEQITELRNKINGILMGEDYKSDMLREKQDYIDEVKKARGKVE